MALRRLLRAASASLVAAVILMLIATALNRPLDWISLVLIVVIVASAGLWGGARGGRRRKP